MKVYMMAIAFGLALAVPPAVAWQDTEQSAAASYSESTAASRLAAAKVFLRQGREDAAKTWLAQAVAVAPDSAAGKEARELLDKLGGAPVPTARPSAPPKVSGQPGTLPPLKMALAKKQEIYKELHRAGMAATREAQKKYPFENMTTNLDQVRELLDNRRELYESLHRRYRSQVGQRFGLNPRQVESIQQEGDNALWPVDEIPPGQAR